MEQALPVLNIVLLGASGFVGRAVLRQIAQRPDRGQVRALVHRAPLPATGSFVTVIRGSITELPGDLLPSMPHVVIHCGSKQIDRDGSGFDVNQRGLECLGSAVNTHTRAILFASSLSVYGDGPQRNVTEACPLRPESGLARSRAACEAVLQRIANERAINAVVFRPRFVIGNGDVHFLPGIADLVRRRLQIGTGEQCYSLIDVDDYARVMLDVAHDALCSPGPVLFEAFNVGYARPIALRDIAQIVRESGSLPPARYRIPAPEYGLRFMQQLPLPAVRRLAHRLRLLGHDHYGATTKLASRLNNTLLQADPRAMVRKAALALPT